MPKKKPAKKSAPKKPGTPTPDTTTPFEDSGRATPSKRRPKKAPATPTPEPAGTPKRRPKKSTGKPVAPKPKKPRTKQPPPAEEAKDIQSGVEPPHSKKDDQYAARREYNRERMANMAREGRDIGELPQVENPERREAGLANLELFLATYFAGKFPLAFSDDHRTVLRKTEQAVKRGGLFAEAMPRGSGKTTIATRAALWAVLNKHPFVALIGATGDGAVEQLDGLKVELETNEMLLADFPDVCWPVWCLEGIPNRCKGQLYRGERTRISWQDKRIILPAIPGSPAASAVIKVVGITGRIRGMQYTRPDGTIARPTLVIVDDPQTDESARSPDQCRKIERTLAGAILGLAGPNTKVSGMMPCTVIVKDDAADRILDRKQHPEWQGERMKAVYAWPDDEKHWNKYGEILRECWATDGDESPATEYYRKNRKAMDKGAIVAWPERKMPDHLSALETAMYLRTRDGDETYFAEYQNDPIDESQADEVETLTPQQIAEKVGSFTVRQIPPQATKLTAFVDVGEKYLYWMVVAWRDDFSGWIVDYGPWPDQAAMYFSKSSAKRTIAKARPGARKEGRILYAIQQCVAMLDTPGRYVRAGGSSVPIDAGMIDAGDGDYTEVVYGFCHGTNGRWVPSFGRGIGAKDASMAEWRKQAGESRGSGWQMPSIARGRPCRHVMFDANAYKSHVHNGLLVAQGDPGSIELYKAKPATHRMLGDHLNSEKGVRVTCEDRGVKRVKTEWIKKPNQDNEGLDVLVGCAVVAARLGCQLPEILRKPGKRERMKLSEIQAARRSGVNATEQPAKDKAVEPEPKKETKAAKAETKAAKAETKAAKAETKASKAASSRRTPKSEPPVEPPPAPEPTVKPRMRLSDIQKKRRAA